MTAQAHKPDLNLLLGELRHRNWTLHIFGPSLASPDMYVATFEWKKHDRADVFILRSEHSASAFRTPVYPKADILAPTTVDWQYHGPPDWTLRAVLTIGIPGTAEAPNQSWPPHPQCTVPERYRERYTTRRTGLNQPPDWSWFDGEG